MLRQRELNVVPQTHSDPPAPPVLQDEALISAVASGDTAALSALYDRYARAVFGIARRMLDSEQTAEEVVQDTFLRVWHRSEQFQAARGGVPQWLLGIAHHLCIDELRRRKSRAVMVLNSDEPQLFEAMQQGGHSVDEEVWLRERRQLIRSALSEIPAEQRRVIELAYLSGLTQSEIASHTGEALGTIKTRVRLGLRKLRDILAERHITGT
ncbi:MAG: sigma-70 family RNA polymerase sigma factor [Roseiflexaceae bacterium]|nr:sigma-70 family RNA polymerase sigma factor [Roseiflexaceae bacterium]